MYRYLSVDIICLKRGTVFQGWGSRKSVPFKECKMSKDKYGRLISSHMEAVVVIILQIILLRCLQMSYCLLHLLFTFQCSLVGPWFRGTFFFSGKKHWQAKCLYQELCWCERKTQETLRGRSWKAAGLWWIKNDLMIWITKQSEGFW